MCGRVSGGACHSLWLGTSSFWWPMSMSGKLAMVYGPWGIEFLDLQLDLVKINVPQPTRVGRSRCESQ
jgi:hypothetical protein